MKKRKKKSKYAHLPKAVRIAIKKTIPLRYRRMYVKAMEGRSRRFAIRVFCLQCVAFVRAEVLRCMSEGCPLYPYRLLMSKSKAERRIAADKVKQKASAERKQHKVELRAKRKKKRDKLKRKKSSSTK